MTKELRGKLGLLAAATVLMVAVPRVALADAGDGPGGAGGGMGTPTPGGPGTTGPGGGRPAGTTGGWGMGGGMGGMGGGMGGGMMGGTAVTVAGDFVYVVQGGTLFQFAVNDLHLVHQAQLPMGGRNGSRPGGGGGMTPPTMAPPGQ